MECKFLFGLNRHNLIAVSSSDKHAQRVRCSVLIRIDPQNLKRMVTFWDLSEIHTITASSSLALGGLSIRPVWLPFQSMKTACSKTHLQNAISLWFQMKRPPRNCTAFRITTEVSVDARTCLGCADASFDLFENKSEAKNDAKASSSFSGLQMLPIEAVDCTSNITDNSAISHQLIDYWASKQARKQDSLQYLTAT